ncbi:hybrid sensor histidine kinase/response regulator transcription factor [Parapedobacter soli]|uniref:hybrid sensor histidine kinase/response regulator transcription factor n=1 Tax=Parapedobacter soli TaxID=416955 RepID=UPI0021C960B7|nr:two-component regulator propeller domain-containing protein [Parapedobacter soli]
MLKQLFLVLFILIAATCYGQAPLDFRNYQVTDGLSSNTITSVYQDRMGFMWFGSRNGLNRFDGQRFHTFKHDPKDSTSIGSNSIFSLHEDSQGQLWVGTYQGIYRFDPQYETFQLFPEIPAGEIRYIHGDQQGNSWIVSNLNLYQYDPATGKVTQHHFSGDQTISLHASETGSIWLATSKGIVKRFDEKEQRFIEYPIQALYGKPTSSIKALCALGDTALLVGTMNELLYMDIRASTVVSALTGPNPLNIHVHTIFKENERIYWIGSESGLLRYDAALQTGELISRQPTNPYSLSNNIVSAICKDMEGGIWLGTYFGGVNYFSPHYNRFRKYFPEPGQPSLSGEIVHEITKDRYGNLWIGTEDAGLNRLNPATGEITAFLPASSPGHLTYHNIHGLLADGDELWVGTYEHGIDVLDVRTGKVIRHYRAAFDGKSFTSDFIITLYRRSNGDILVGTWNGLFKYLPVTDTFSPLPFFDGHIQSIHEDGAGTLWVGTYGSGVFYQNTQTGKEGHFQHQINHHGILVNNYVNHVYGDRHGQLWFCTEGGLTRFDPITESFQHYTVADGLPDNQVFRVLEDDTGSYWVSTGKGLCRYDASQDAYERFHIDHGLPTEQFNYNSSFKDTNGTLYFGTLKGLVSFRPRDFSKSQHIPQIYITGLQIDHRTVGLRDPESPLKKAMTYTDALTLPFNSTNISIDAAVISYVIPSMNRYQYKMDGIDKEWVTAQQGHPINYSRLSPGQYTFHLRGANHEGLWGDHERILHITVTPPFWLSGWAYFLYLVVVGGIVAVVLRYYFLALNEKNKRKLEQVNSNKERELYHAKIEFFTNVAHEIRTPLTLIKMPLDKLLATSHRHEDDQEQLTLIERNTNTLISLTNELLDFRKAEANKLNLNLVKANVNELVTEIYQSFIPFAEKRGLDYQLLLPATAITIALDREAVKKILNNLIGNALKYAASTVTVNLLSVKETESLLRIECYNDGPPIPALYHEKIFEPFFRVPNRSKETGTGIGLSLARFLAELHQGNLVLDRQTDPGALFVLSLPTNLEEDIRTLQDFAPVTNEESGDLADDVKRNDQRPSLLIVEDNWDIIHYLQRELAGNYKVLKASHGQEALNLLAQHEVHLIVTDIMMPVMDGITLSKTVKNDLRFSHIPIILLTAQDTLNTKIEGLEVGADAYLSKPFSMQHLVAQIENLLANRRIIKEHFSSSPLGHLRSISTSKADQTFLKSLNEVIDAHMVEEAFDVDKLAALMNMSKPTLYRKIKGLSDLTPNELINLSKLKKAAELLATGDYKVNEVAHQMGYTTPSNFSRDFQKQFGMSPSAFMQNVKPTVNSSDTR